MLTDARLRVWYDGACVLCRRSRAWCEDRTDARRVDFIDFRTVPDDRLPVPRHELESALWVQAADGRLYRGFEGWRRILDVVPRWRWLSRIFGVSPFSRLGPPVYRLVARSRGRFGAGGSLPP